MKLFFSLILSFTMIFSTALVTWAEDESSIFGDDEMTEEISETTTQNETKPLDEKLKIGGDFSFVFDPTWTYGDDWQWLKESLEPNLVGRLYFDARPDEDSRYFGKFRVSYPFTTNTTVVTDVLENPYDPANEIIVKTSIGTVNLQIQELFSDFNYQDKIFFRAGKHTIKWGVGYFFSPADVLNLTPIDPTDPEAEREGPVSLKIHYPFGANKVNNFYGYLIANNVEKPGDLAIALKGEYLLGNLELGVGAFYQPQLSPRAVLMATLPTKSVDFFGELVLSYGSDKTFIEKDGLSGDINTVQKKDELFPSLTVGFNYMTEKVSIIGQYLYNGEGYNDLAVFNKDDLPEIMKMITTGQLGFNDIYLRGRHYGAVFTRFSELFNNPDLSFSLLWIENFGDLSWQLTPGLSWKMHKKATLTLSLPVLSGAAGMEFADMSYGSTKSLSLSINLGNGSF